MRSDRGKAVALSDAPDRSRCGVVELEIGSLGWRGDGIADDISGVKHVQNNLRVHDQRGAAEDEAGATAGRTGTASTAGQTARPAGRRG